MSNIKKIIVWVGNWVGKQVRPYKWTPWANTVAYYPLTSNANDYSWNGYNATNYSATFSETDGGYFWTYTSRLQLPSMTIWNIFTISSWVKLASVPTGDQEFDIYYDWSAAYRNILYRLGTNKIDCWTGNNGSSHDASITASLSQWTTRHNYILVKNWTSINIYKDWSTTPILSKTSSYNPSIPWWWNTVCVWHSTWWSASYSVSWYIKDYIIEKGIWSTTQISDYYNSTKSNYWL